MFCLSHSNSVSCFWVFANSAQRLLIARDSCNELPSSVFPSLLNFLSLGPSTDPWPVHGPSFDWFIKFLLVHLPSLLLVGWGLNQQPKRSLIGSDCQLLEYGGRCDCLSKRCIHVVSKMLLSCALALPLILPSSLQNKILRDENCQYNRW